jgi:hypothetical protein
MTEPMTAERRAEIERYAASFYGPECGMLRELLAENARLAEELDGANGCLSMVRDFLTAVGCECQPGTHDATPPSCYPEWIACAMRAYAAKACQQLQHERRD